MNNDSYYTRLPNEIIIKISSYYPSPELTITNKCNISKLVFTHRINKIKKQEKNKIKERTILAIDRLYNKI